MLQINNYFYNCTLIFIDRNSGDLQHCCQITTSEILGFIETFYERKSNRHDKESRKIIVK